MVFRAEEKKVVIGEEDKPYEWLVYPFHSSHINGLDLCLKKQLVATCSHDNSIRIWNYATKSLEICEQFMDEPMSLAFHPSGLHIIVGFVDKIRMMNVFARNIKSYNEIQIKGCKEIKFSNGGHLFACANQISIHIYRFYTASLPQEYVFKEHQSRIKCITWMDDDTGFITAALDGSVLVWRLNSDVSGAYDRARGEVEK